MEQEKDVYESAIIVEGLRACDFGRNKKLSNSAFDMYETLHGRQPDTMFRASFGHLLENFRLWHDTKAKGMNEGTSQANMPVLRDYGFELITALMPGLIANDIVVTQPAKFKNFSIFYQDFVKQTTKGATTTGDNAITALTADSFDVNYTKDSEVNKVVGTGDGGTANYTGTAAFLPVVASTVTITATDVGDNAMAVIDDGAGALTGDVGVGVNTISYVTGAWDVTFNANVKNLTSVLLTYEFVGEGSKDNAAELGMTISEIQGVAKERRLRYNFTIESQFSYRQQWGRSMDADLLAAAMAEIRKEIDQELVELVYTTASDAQSAGAVTWDRTPDAGVQYHYWREQFIDTLNAAGNLIIKALGLGDANVVVGGLNFKQVCETIGQPRYVSSNNNTSVKGSRFIGTIDGKIRCYYEPALDDNAFAVTYRSSNPLEVGISYNPWMPLFASDPHMLADGRLHRYLITGSGKTVINKKYYVKGTLTQT